MGKKKNNKSNEINYIRDDYNGLVKDLFDINGVTYGVFPRSKLGFTTLMKGVSNLEGEDTNTDNVYVRKDPETGRWYATRMDTDRDNIAAYDNYRKTVGNLSNLIIENLQRQSHEYLLSLINEADNRVKETSVSNIVDDTANLGYRAISTLGNYFNPSSGDIIDLSNENVILIHPYTNPQYIKDILANDFVELRNPGTFTAEQIKNGEVLNFSDKYIPIDNINTFYGIEDGKLKVGDPNIFNDETTIIPNRIKSDKVKEVLVPHGDDRWGLVTENNDTIYPNLNLRPKILFSDEKGNAIFYSDKKYNTDGPEEIREALVNKLNLSLLLTPRYPIMVDNGRFSNYQLNNPNISSYTGVGNTFNSALDDDMYIIGTSKADGGELDLSTNIYNEDNNIDWSKDNLYLRDLSNDDRDSRIREYLDIENRAKEENKWLRMSDGTTWLGDPRMWVYMKSPYYKKQKASEVIDKSFLDLDRELDEIRDNLYGNGGKVKRSSTKNNEKYTYLNPLFNDKINNETTVNGVKYATVSNKYLGYNKGTANPSNLKDSDSDSVYVRKDERGWRNTRVDEDMANILDLRSDRNDIPSTFNENSLAASAYDPNSELVRPNIERLLYWDPVNKQIRDRQLSERLSSYTAGNFLSTIIPAHLADPMNYLGAGAEYLRGNGNFFLNSLSGNNKGMFSLSDNLSDWAEEHPYLSTGANLLGNAALLGVGALGRNIALKGGIPLSPGYRYHMFLPKGNNFYYRIGDGIAEDAVKRGRIIGRMTEQPFFLRGRSVAGKYSYRGNQDILLRRETGKYEWPQMDWEGNLVDPNNVKEVTMPQGYTVKWNTAGERPILINDGEVTPMINGLIGIADSRDFQLIKPINIKGFNIGYTERPLVR